MKYFYISGHNFEIKKATLIKRKRFTELKMFRKCLIDRSSRRYKLIHKRSDADPHSINHCYMSQFKITVLNNKT